MRAGETIAGRFALEGEIAAGGMGKVFRAIDRQSGAPVALKIILPEADLDPERFLRESVMLAELSHPGIVRYVAHGTSPSGEPYLVMEWLDGEDLSHYLTRRGGVLSTAAASPHARSTDPTVTGKTSNMSIDDAIALTRRVASALGELHRHGLVHRDVKPSNVFLVGGNVERAKLLDFGVARATSARPVTRSGALVGTPSYMAPEQARAAREIDARADVWALGCVLYECLAGEAPFTGRQLMAVLAKILLDPAPRLRSVRPDAPIALDDLVARMLSKDIGERPLDGNAIVDELSVFASGTRTLASAGPISAPAPESLTEREERLHCVLLAARREGDDDDEAFTMRLRAAVEPFGGKLEQLASGPVLVSLASTHGATDGAARAARAAMALQRAMDGVPLVLASGRSAGVGSFALGDILDRAARDLGTTPNGAVRVDDLTAQMLEARFDLAKEDGAVFLRGERDASEGVRTLLGKPTTWVGRERELAMLEGLLAECIGEPISRAVLVTAPAGVGKSRLRFEMVRRARQRDEEIEVLFGQGDSLSAGSPFVMIAPAIRRCAGILDGEAIEVRREKLRARIARHVAEPDRARVTELLGELVSVPFPDDASEALRAARRDPMLMGDAMRGAFETWLHAECAAHPVLLVLEDLHWGDLPAVKFIDAALRSLRDAPFMVLALARPEVHTQFPRLWAERNLQEIRLDTLTKRASQKLVKQVLGDRADDAVVSRIVERAEGNAFYLEELIRAVASDASMALPESVLGMLQSRLDAMSVDARRVLRAGSVFGEVFWLDGVVALLGGRASAATATEWLDDLVSREVITERGGAKMPGETEYVFRHALVREAAYAMLTGDDRALGHRLAGAWLEGAGETDALALAEHFDRGGDPERARRWYRRAAEQALEGNDLTAAIARGERAVACAAEGEMLGALRLLQAVASYWQSRYDDGVTYAERAASLLPRGSSAWFRAVAEAAVSGARRGTYETVDHWIEEAKRADADSDARAAQIVCLCRCSFQLVFNARFADADVLLARVAELVAAAGEIDPATLAQFHHVRGVRAAHVADVGTFLTHLEAAIAAFEQAGDMRNASLERPTLGWCMVELGLLDDAERILREATERCRRMGAEQATTYALVNLGYALALAGKVDEARRIQEQARESCRAQKNPRLEGWSRVHLSTLELGAGRFAEAEREAAAATELLRVSPGLRAWALAAHARALLAIGRVEEALAEARDARATQESLGGILQGDSLVPLVLAEALAASGDASAASAAFAAATTRLLDRASRLGRPEWRATFLALPDNARTLEPRRPTA